MDTSKIKAVIVAVLALFAALYLGITAATAQFETVMWTVGGVALVTCLVLGRRIYLIIPLLTSLQLVLPLPGFSTSLLIGQILFIAFFVLLFLTRRIPYQVRFSELEFWCLLLILTVAQAYVRHPVGLNLLGGHSVGGKPYITFAITVVSSFFLSILIVPAKEIKTFAYLTLIGSILNFSLGLMGKIFPTLGFYLGASFSTDVASNGSAAEPAEGPTRISFVRGLAITLAAWIPSRISPLRALLHPGWLALMLGSVALAALSGYRSQFVLAALTLMIGVYYHHRLPGMLFSLFSCGLALSILALYNAASPLPPNIQRSLSFLPGSWDKQIKQGAEGSTEWRVEMWKEALFTDRWIENKWLGDGLGFTRQELEAMKIFSEAKRDNQIGRSGLSIQQESMMISGGYHSGPVQTIRTTGYVGLAVMLLAMTRLALRANRIITRSFSTEWQAPVLFLGLPIVVLPFFWTFVFGTFDTGIITIFMGAAIVRLMEKNLDLGNAHRTSPRKNTISALRPSTQRIENPTDTFSH